MRLLSYIIILTLFISTNSNSKINLKDYGNIFSKYNLTDEYNFNNISTICLNKFKNNNTRVYKNKKNEEILEIDNEKEFLNCTYNEILEVIKPIPLVNSLPQKSLENFILGNEITITKGLNQEKLVFVFNENEYIQYKGNKEVKRDSWRWGKIGKPLRVFMNGDKTTWKVSKDQKALTIKVGKEKAVPYFLTYENKQVAQKKRDDLIAKQKAEKERIKKEKIEKERLAKLNDLKENKLNQLNKIIKDNEENSIKLFEILTIKTKMGKNTQELNSILDQYNKKISDIKNKISNFDNFNDLEKYQISSDFLNPINEILNLQDYNLDLVKSEYEQFKIEEEKRQAELKRKQIEEEKRQAELKRKRIEEEKRQAELKRKRIEEEKRLAKIETEKKCKNIINQVDKVNFDFLGVNINTPWECFVFKFENSGYRCGNDINVIILGQLTGCEIVGKPRSWIGFGKGESVMFACNTYGGCERTLEEVGQSIVDKYSQYFQNGMKLDAVYDQQVRGNIYRGTNQTGDQLIEVMNFKGIGGIVVKISRIKKMKF